MSTVVDSRLTDAKGRVVLPKGFANVTVILEQISETEVRVRRAKVVPEDDLVFTEELADPLSGRDRDHLLDLLASPPEPNEALKAAADRHKVRRG